MRITMTRRAWTRACGIIGGLALLILGGIHAPASLGQATVPTYPLYYAFQIPPSRPSIQLSSNGSSTSYSGTFTGTLGGIPLKSGTFQYGGATGSQVGGGYFTLVTDAGAVTNTQVLMSVDGPRTSVLFFGTYLGTHLDFRLSVEGMALGGQGETDTGLADTGFASIDAYVAAVQTAAASLPDATKQQLITAANTNALLVTEYQQKNR